MMRMSEMGNRWDEERIRQLLRESAEKEQIPESLKPKQMEQWLRQHAVKTAEKGEEPMEKREHQSEKNAAKQKKGRNKKYLGWWCGTFAAAACLALILFAAGRNVNWDLGRNRAADGASEESAKELSDKAKEEESGLSAAKETEEGTTYQKLYQSFESFWAQQEELYQNDRAYATTDEAADGAAAEDAKAAVGESGEMNSAADTGGAMKQEEAADSGAGDYGKTNQQEEEVEEADIIKNDGRYLYQAVCRKQDGRYTVRIVDTKGGLKECAQVGSFENIQDIYVWEDKLVVLQPGWAEGAAQEQPQTFETEYKEQAGGFLQVVRNITENLFVKKAEAAADIWISGYAYCRIHVYDISDRSDPREYHTFTVKGSYMDSRISDGYLYLFASCDTSRPKDQEDLKAYVPTFDGKPMQEDKITLPEGTKAAAYLVMASVDMERPDEFVDTRALVTSADKFYVSQKNIYVADTQYFTYGEKESGSDSTRIFRYSYKDGRMRKEAEGEVKGTLRDDMAMNEYQDHLRLVTTVESHNVEEIVDDISGETLGYDSTSQETVNSLYVLNRELRVTGKIENLAPGERVYSARFMGNAGYFVTFRETDPLFSVDLADPANPKILGELKISGFSEYLHFYADGLLLGIGMEADENTGETEGMKLSMFDISNPADVKEQSKMDLSEFGYSEALYNYKAVLIDTKKNLFGFSAEDYTDDYNLVYLLFTYENGEFRQIMKVDCSDDARYGGQVRGTYIGERFFLLADDGLVEEYSLKDGSKTGALEI